MVQGSDTKYYGTTETLGANNQGTVFKTSSAGELTTLYAFCALSNCADGAGPVAGVVEDSDGNYYGTTVRGGTSTTCNLGCGTIFKITPEGTLTTLHSFSSTDGSGPSFLIRGSDNNLYGTTTSGGAFNKGTIYQITMGGTFTSLHSFSSGDGINPVGGLMQATDGNFYGTTELSGSTANLGTIYRLSTGLAPFVKTLTSSGKPGATVKILGTNLTGATSVTFNGTSVAFSVVSPSEISATVPSGATTGKVQVMTPGGMLTTNMAFVVLP